MQLKLFEICEWKTPIKTRYVHLYFYNFTLYFIFSWHSTLSSYYWKCKRSSRDKMMEDVNQLTVCAYTLIISPYILYLITILYYTFMLECKSSSSRYVHGRYKSTRWCANLYFYNSTIPSHFRLYHGILYPHWKQKSSSSRYGICMEYINQIKVHVFILLLFYLTLHIFIILPSH